MAESSSALIAPPQIPLLALSINRMIWIFNLFYLLATLLIMALNCRGDNSGFRECIIAFPLPFEEVTPLWIIITISEIKSCIIAVRYQPKILLVIAIFGEKKYLGNFIRDEQTTCWAFTGFVRHSRMDLRDAGEDPEFRLC